MCCFINKVNKISHRTTHICTYKVNRTKCCTTTQQGHHNRTLSGFEFRWVLGGKRKIKNTSSSSSSLLDMKTWIKTHVYCYIVGEAAISYSNLFVIVVFAIIDFFSEFIHQYHVHMYIHNIYTKLYRHLHSTNLYKQLTINFCTQ